MGEGDQRLMRWGVLALIGAMLADLAETIVDPANTDNETKLFNAAAQHSDRMVISAACLLASALLIVPGVWLIARGLKNGGHRAGVVASVLALLGAIGHTALMTTYLVLAQMPKGGADSATMVDLIHRINHSAAYLVMTGPPTIAFPLALLTIFIATYRAGLLPRWTLATIIGAPVAAIALGSVSVVASTGTALVLFLVTALVLAARLFGDRAPAAPQAAPA